MKKLLTILFLFLLISCDADEITDTKVDNDDINLIDKVGKQSLDKAIELYDTNTRAS
ncbi:MAG: hypothetical protein PHH98_02760 [Candidatus Gracilibacteria bacterium]|nr:hypothetical protein [Candidatus Gracilibacteria bacterium]